MTLFKMEIPNKKYRETYILIHSILGSSKWVKEDSVWVVESIGNGFYEFRFDKEEDYVRFRLSINEE